MGHFVQRHVCAFAVAQVCLCGAALGQVIATSNFDDGPQGWTFDVAAMWRATDGNPLGCVQNFGEPTNGPAWANAAPEFLGDWTSLDGGRGVLRFDHQRVSNGGGQVLAFIPIIVEVSGPAGTATWESELLPEIGPWRSFEIPITESEWAVPKGMSWAAILADVRRVRFFLEQVSNTEEPEDLNLLDNVSLSFACRADFNGDGAVNSQDFFDFLTAFFASEPEADFNADGMINSQDFFDFLGAFFARC